MENLIEMPSTVHAFRPETENFDLGQKGYHRKGHLKGSMAQVSAPYVAPSSESVHQSEIPNGHNLALRRTCPCLLCRLRKAVV